MLYQYYPTLPHTAPYELNKDFTFAAAHSIENAGKCANLHGHNYTVNVTIVGSTLNEQGFLVNFSDLKKLVHDEFDHKNLWDSIYFDELNQPSTENLAKVIYEILDLYVRDNTPDCECLQVIVRETPTSYVIYRGVL